MAGTFEAEEAVKSKSMQGTAKGSKGQNDGDSSSENRVLAVELQLDNQKMKFLSEKLEILSAETGEGLETSSQHPGDFEETREMISPAPQKQIPFYDHESMGIAKITVPCKQLSDSCFRLAQICPQITDVFEKIARTSPEKIITMRQMDASPAKMFALSIELLSSLKKFERVVVSDPIFVPRYNYCKSNLELTVKQLILLCEVLHKEFKQIDKFVSQKLKISNNAFLRQLEEDIAHSCQTLDPLTQELKELATKIETFSLNNIKTRKIDAVGNIDGSYQFKTRLLSCFGVYQFSIFLFANFAIAMFLVNLYAWYSVISS